MQVEHSCECRDTCFLRCPRPCPCTPCCCPRNPICLRDKQPKIVASILGYFRIDRESKSESNWHSDVNANCDTSVHICTNGGDRDQGQYKGWVGRALYDECREQRNWKLRYTTSGLYGRGFNNLYKVCSPCQCGKPSCDCDCDLYAVCNNDKY